MSLDHAILGFLNYTPFSGPDLKKVFDASVRHFWPADQSQIYRTLSRLSASGWVDLERVEGEARAEQKVYHITEAGRAELHRWLTAPLQFDEVRTAAPMPVSLGAQLSEAEILATFERAAAQLRGLLARYEDVPAAMGERKDRFGSPREEYFWQLTLEYGISWAWAQLGWLESVIERIGSGERPDA
jgi:PadR family transcriptional regulator AphA